MDKLVEQVLQWAKEKDILKKENATKQLCKVMEELGETASAVVKNNEPEIKDGLGDVLVTVIILARQLGYTPEECLQTAYDEIKDRKGKTINGVFIKN